MTASQSRKSAHRARCRSIGHDRVRSNIQPSTQIGRQLTAFNNARRSFMSRSPRPTRWIGSTPITHLIRGTQIPIAHAAPPTYPSRGFLPWRFADAGPGVRGATVMGPASENLHQRRKSVLPCFRDRFILENGRRGRRDPCHSRPAHGRWVMFGLLQWDDWPSQPLHLRLLGPATCENDAPSFASRQHELRRRHVARIQSMGR